MGAAATRWATQIWVIKPVAKFVFSLTSGASQSQVLLHGLLHPHVPENALQGKLRSVAAAVHRKMDVARVRSQFRFV